MVFGYTPKDQIGGPLAEVLPFNYTILNKK